jgi:phosphoglycerate kinase
MDAKRIKAIRRLSDLQRSELESKRVLVRVDFNVPLDKSLNITDDSRIQASLETIKYLIENQSKVILVSHLGRPDGEVIESARLNPVAERLSVLLNQKVIKMDEAVGDLVKARIAQLQNGEVLLLENIRFYKGETKNDEKLSRQLAELADVYVNDAFGTAHRAHSSTEGVSHFVKPSVAGFLIAKELEMLGSKLDSPERPFTAIIGGSKISSKISVLKKLVEKVDTLLIGGGMAYSFIKAQGGQIGKSICENDQLDLAREIINLADEKGTALILPEDSLCTQAISEDGNPINIFEKYSTHDSFETRVFNSNAIDPRWQGMDLGPKARSLFNKIILQSRTVVWNGPLGVFEYDVLQQGTREAAEALIQLTQEKEGTTIVGGGDSVAALEKFNMSKAAFTHVSTGGGASLEFLEGQDLPGIMSLDFNEVYAA